MSQNKIIQWNCRGFRANYDEIKRILNEHNPTALCLQETFLKDKDKINIPNFSIYSSFSVGEHSSGGVSILVNRTTPHRVLPLNTNIQAVAVNVTAEKSISLCSIYIPPSSNLIPQDLDDLVSQLPAPFILLGDFNGHSPLWGSRDLNDKGKKIENFINRHDLCLFNDKSHTYLHPATGSYSSLDLSLCSPEVLVDFSWEVSDDLCGSDHFPIFLTSNGPSVSEQIPRWKLSKADWTQFQSLCDIELHSDLFETSDDAIADFTNILHNIAEKTIPKTSTNPKRFNKPWFNDDCKEAIKARKQVLREFNTNPTQDNLNKFRVFRAKARRTIKESKRTSWRNYVSKLNSRSSIKKTWDMVRKIKGKGKVSPINHLKRGNDNVTSKKDIADVLAEAFSKNSSSNHYTEKFRKYKDKAEKQKLNFKSNNTEDYNHSFSIKELQDSLSKAHDSSAGPDEIHYQLLKHLTPSALNTLLSIFNRIWQSGNFPPSWREATVVPIPKPGKDHTNPTNYRPIALTSCVCKTMERMINERLVWYLESNNLITEFQSGFRHQRSTQDHLVRFETFVREAFVKKEHLVSVFFDLEKAYDTTWKYGIMNDLHDFGLKGRLPNFIQNFLTDRQFQVRVGSTLSDFQDQEMGVPQGSILSVTLFSIKINSIVKCLNPGVDCSLYVDDFLICYRSKNMNTIERQLQQCLNKLQDWSDKNGFKFSKSKTVCMHFCQLRGMHNDPDLRLDGIPIPVVEEFKFLGLIFDRKLSFIPHIKFLKAKCQKALDLLRVVSNTDWGADRTVLLRLYRSIIRSKLDYGCSVYGSARKSYLRMLDPIHNQGLRLCLGAFRTSPVESLYAEADEPSLSDRRDKLSLQFALKLRSNPGNPAYKCVFEPLYAGLFDLKPNTIPSFGIRIQPLITDSHLNDSFDFIADYRVSQSAPWLLKQPTLLFDLNRSKKSQTHPTSYISSFLDIRARYPNHTCLYTDGSKVGECVGSAAVAPSGILRCRIPDGATVFSAEMKALLLALDFIESADDDRFIIFTDSLSSMQALQSRKLSDPLVLEFLERFDLMSTEKNIVLCWLPSHIGIEGNEKADLAARSALALPLSNIKLNCSNFKPLIFTFIRSRWQSCWDLADSNKLHSIKPTLGPCYSPGVTIRRDEVVLSRVRIGHTYLTHAFLLKGEDRPECVFCQCYLTVKHLLVECVDLADARRNYFTAGTMEELFSTVPAHQIIEFLKEVGLYFKL